MPSTPPAPTGDDETPSRGATAKDSADPAADARDARPPATPPGDRVDDWGLSSFPASDPPSWWAGR
jgi:hypothetical protein